MGAPPDISPSLLIIYLKKKARAFVFPFRLFERVITKLTTSICIITRSDRRPLFPDGSAAAAASNNAKYFLISAASVYRLTGALLSVDYITGINLISGAQQWVVEQLVNPRWNFDRRHRNKFRRNVSVTIKIPILIFKLPWRGGRDSQPGWELDDGNSSSDE